MVYITRLYLNTVDNDRDTEDSTTKSGGKYQKMSEADKFPLDEVALLHEGLITPNGEATTKVNDSFLVHDEDFEDGNPPEIDTAVKPSDTLHLAQDSITPLISVDESTPLPSVLPEEVINNPRTNMVQSLNSNNGDASVQTPLATPLMEDTALSLEDVAEDTEPFEDGLDEVEDEEGRGEEDHLKDDVDDEGDPVRCCGSAVKNYAEAKEELADSRAGFAGRRGRRGHRES